MIRATILGCGSSGGVPRIGGIWGVCDPDNPKNRRRRCSLLVEQVGDDGGATRLLIDTGPDFVPQMLDAGVSVLDAVAYTHPHADHIHGIDDIRQITMNGRRLTQIWADAPTTEVLASRFGYVFETPPGSYYPPVAQLNLITGPFAIQGEGGEMLVTPFEVIHGEIPALGFRIGGLVYLPDVSQIPDEVWPVIEGAEIFICDALRRKPHPSHAHLDLALEWLERSGTRRGIVTNMHVDMDFDQVAADTPDWVEPAHDGMVIRL